MQSMITWFFTRNRVVDFCVASSGCC